VKHPGNVNRKFEKMFFWSFFSCSPQVDGLAMRRAVEKLHVNSRTRRRRDFLALNVAETALEHRYWLLNFERKLDNILHKGMFFPGTNGRLTVILVLQLSVSSCFRGKTP